MDGNEVIQIGRFGKTKSDIINEMGTFPSRLAYINHLSNKARNDMKVSDLFSTWQLLGIIEWVSSLDDDTTHPNI